MKRWIHYLVAGLLAIGAASTVRAQSQPVLSVSLTEIDILSGTGGVAFIPLTNVGAGYQTAPTVTITPAIGDPGTGASAEASINVDGQVSGIRIISSGSGYLTAPTVTISAATGTNAVTAQARAYLGTTKFIEPTQNESYYNYGTPIALTALAVGTFPAGGFTYSYFANGISIGTATPNPPAGSPATILWTPPQPGSYYITVTASDGANTATSLPVRYFSVGTALTNPTPNKIVPQGSSVVVQAAATPRPLSGPAGGSGYDVAPVVTITGGGGSGATAVANLTGGVTGITLTANGSGYTATPTVTLTGGGGAGATAQAMIGTGTVTGITVTGGGSGYVSVPTVTLSGGGGTGASAVATITAGQVTGITITAGGTGYTSVPTVALSGGGGTGATATAAINGIVGIYMSNYGSGYTSAPGVVISGGGGSGAAATASISNTVGGFTITSGGSGYTSTPTVTITNAGSTGSGANAYSNIDLTTSSSPTYQQVTSLTLTGSDAFVKKIDFYADGVLIGSDDTSPYSIIYTPANAPATHTLEAKAYDNNGNQVSPDGAAAIGLSMVPPIGTAPTVEISSPGNNAILPIPSGSTGAIPVAVSATSPDAKISKVELYVDGALIGTSTTFPYSFTWTPTVVGTYGLIALAYDDRSNIVASRPTPVEVKIAAQPTVALIAPVGGSTIALNSPVNLTAAASDSNLGGSITKVQFFANGAFVGDTSTVGSGNQYTFTWSPTVAGSISLTAVAIDNLGLSSTSAAISVTASNGGGGGSGPIGQPPVVNISYPTASTQVLVNKPTPITAKATDLDGNIVSVQFFANNQSLGTSTTYPYGLTWTPTSLGSYNLTAKATDNDGNAVTSIAVRVTVTDPTSGSSPTVSIAAPLDGTTVNVGSAQTLKADATDAGSIAGVQFFVDGQPLGSLITVFPYTTTWTPSSPGSYIITARAINASGNQTTSDPATIKVTAGAPPAVTLTAPTDGSILPVNAPQTLTATASSTAGTIASVQFFVNGVLVGTKTAFPYTAAWTPSAAGSYVIFARATDNLGNFTDSTPTATVTVATGSAPTVTVTNPVNNSTYAVATALTLNATAADADGTVTQVQFFVNGVATGAAATRAPYSVAWTPGASGTYLVTAQATDNSGNITTSDPVTVKIAANGAPSVSIVRPVAGAVVSAGTAVNLVASAADGDGTVTQVRFLANGSVVGTTVVTTPFATTWTPTAPGTYTLVAEATDNSGNVTNSAPISLSVIANQPPVVSLTFPGNNYGTTAGLPVALSATASDADGTINNVRFIVNGLVVGSPVTTAPYTVSWIPSTAGTYTVTAEATDNVGNITDSSPVTVNVAGNLAPTISITSPTNGTTIRVGSATTIAATAKDTDGTIANVQFYVNGSPLLGPIVAYPYTTTWTPASEGVYRITAIATDNGGAATTASTTTVLAVTALSVATDNVYTGPFNAIGDNGRFAVIVSGGKVATFIAYSTKAPGKVYYFPDLAVDSVGNFTGTDAGGDTISGNSNPTGVTITLNGSTLLIGIIASSNGTTPVPAGHYLGNLSGNAASTLDAIVGADGSIMVYLANGSSTDAVAGSLTSTGSMLGSGSVVPTSALTKSTFAINIDPASGFLTGSVTGTNAGMLSAALASGSAFSDGALRNLSTRGEVGTDANVLIAGFVVAGNTPKNVLIRAIGPSLSIFNLDGLLADPQLQLKNSNGTTIASNDNWSNDTAIATAASQVGAFPLNPTSHDSAILMQLNPGSYSAIVSGANNTSGLALVEFYDVDNASPFTAQKVINVSTRGLVGTGSKQLIAGFVVNGNIPKKVLIRAVGPSLSTIGLTSGYVSDPALRLSHSVNNVDTLVRENDNWQQGNDPTLVTEAASKVGAFPLNSGSKDAAILITLPPGIYTAQVTSANGTTGLALVEVYEVP